MLPESSTDNLLPVAEVLAGPQSHLMTGGKIDKKISNHKKTSHPCADCLPAF
jgi:hypothetical protein